LSSIGWITYYFPPIAGGGINRNLEIPLHLKRMGWDVSIYTPHPGRYVRIKDVDTNWLNVVRFPTIDPLHLGKMSGTGGMGRRDKLTFPDNKVLILPFLFNAMKKHDIYVVSAPPFSLFVAGLILKKMGYRWVAEFRDPYVDGTLGNYLFPLLNNMAESYERSVVKNADAVITLSPGLTEMFKKRYRKGNIFTITNGYSEEDFKDIKKIKGKDFTLTYMGSFNRTHSPDIVIEALEILKRKGITNFRFQVVGNILPEYMRRFKEFPFFRYRGYLDRKEAIETIVNSDALLLLLTPEESPYAIPGKTFEYIRAGKPIILISEEGELKRLLNGGCIHAGYSPEKIADVIIDVMNGEKTDTIPPRKFEWGNLAADYSKILWSLL